jgi:hypothetical protein
VLLEGQTAPGLPFLRRLHWIITPDPSSEKDAIFSVVDGKHGHGAARVHGSAAAWLLRSQHSSHEQRRCIVLPQTRLSRSRNYRTSHVGRRSTFACPS